MVVWYVRMLPEVSAPLPLLQAWSHSGLGNAGWKPPAASSRVKQCSDKARVWLRSTRKPPTVSVPVGQFTDKQSAPTTPRPPHQICQSTYRKTQNHRSKQRCFNHDLSFLYPSTWVFQQDTGTLTELMRVQFRFQLRWHQLCAATIR